MAQGRIINKSISLSEKANTISDAAALLYSWMIPHSDDFGLLQGSPMTIKALVAPMRSWSIEQVKTFIDEMVDVGLVRVVKYEAKTYYQIQNSKQNLRRDRNPQTILPVAIGRDTQTNWQSIDAIVAQFDGHLPVNDGHVTGTDCHLAAEVKRSEVKRINTGDAEPRPVVKKTETDSIQSTLEGKYGFKVPQLQKAGVYTPWQDKALRYAEALKIELTGNYRQRWFKAFKDANGGRNKGNLERAYSYLFDYTKPLTNDQKIRFFFSIFENGLDNATF